MTKVLCVLYDDPIEGYPPQYARDDIPKLTKYPDGQTTPTPSAIDFKPGELLGSVSGELGLRKFLEKAGHTLVVTSDKDGANSTLDKELTDAEVIIYGYHRFVKKVHSAWTEILPEDFEKQMQELKNRGIPVISMQDMLAWKRGEKNIPARAAIITFDDGWKSQYEVAWPIMKKRENRKSREHKSELRL